MIKSLNKTCALGGLLALSLSAFAGGSTEVVAQKSSHFNVYAEGIWVRATENHNYVLTDASPDPDEVRILQAQSNLGFTLGAGYTFDNQSDIHVEYFHFNPRTKDMALIHNNNNLGTIYTRDTYQGVNVDLGQSFHPTEKLTLRAFTGLAWRSYENQLHGWNNNIAGQYISMKNNGKFSGFGPRFGMDGCYHFRPQLALVASTALSMPYGQLKATRHKGDNNNDNLVGFQLDQLMPEIATRLGLKTAFDMGGTHLALESGVKMVHLFNATTTFDSAEFSGSTHDIVHQDVSFWGPYVRLGAQF